MKNKLLLLALACSGPVCAHDYPTTDRVEYVLECMHRNGGEQAFLYKCACAIDAIAAAMSYDDYVAASTVTRYQGMGGEAAGVFRDPPSMKEMAKHYRAVQSQANAQCGIGR